MAQKDLKNNLKVVIAIAPQTIATNTTTTGSIVDTLGYESVTVIPFSATITDGTFTPVINDGDNSALSDEAVVVDDFLIGTEALAALVAADDNATKKLGYVGKKRYIRPDLVSTGTSSGGLVGVMVILSDAITQPTA